MAASSSSYFSSPRKIAMLLLLIIGSTNSINHNESTRRRVQFAGLFDSPAPTPTPGTPSPSRPIANAETQQSSTEGTCFSNEGRPSGCTCESVSQCLSGLDCVPLKGANFCVVTATVVTEMPVTSQVLSTSAPTKSPITSFQRGCSQPEGRPEACPCSVGVKPPQCAFGLECLSTNGAELCFVDSSTEFPSARPSVSPSLSPSVPPSAEPTKTPVPTKKPTPRPTRKPTVSPRPTRKPSPAPSAQPSKSPSPTRQAANQQTKAPTISPRPTSSPSRSPSSSPTTPVECRVASGRPIGCPCSSGTQCATGICLRKLGQCDT